MKDDIVSPALYEEARKYAISKTYVRCGNMKDCSKCPSNIHCEFRSSIDSYIEGYKSAMKSVLDKIMLGNERVCEDISDRVKFAFASLAIPKLNHKTPFVE